MCYNFRGETIIYCRKIGEFSIFVLLGEKIGGGYLRAGGDKAYGNDLRRKLFCFWGELYTFLSIFYK